jgi:phosphatidylglycerol:prolipoprotein diacylglycerol transferase
MTHPTRDELPGSPSGFVTFLVPWRLRQHTHAEGWLFGVYLVLAGLERVRIEFLRARDDRFFAGLTAAQMPAVAVPIVSPARG